MPLIRVDTAAALSNIKDNPAGRWPRRDEPGRLAPIARPAFKPSFALRSGERIFTIGSCFARHVERELLHRGFDLPTRRLFESDEAFGAAGLDVLNNYGTPSILNELRWAFDANFDADICFEPIRDKWVDMHIHSSIRPTDIDTLRNRRQAIGAAYRSIQQCAAVIITLGLAEVWYDNEKKLYLNVAPRRSLLREFPRRFELHVLSLEETYGFLKEALEIIATNGAPNLRVVLTVSPVPLSGTYRAVDVMEANAYSKAVLRVAAEMARLEFEFVDYFPSFESVTLSERDVAWTDDNVHVTDDIVNVNVGRMVSSYTGQRDFSLSYIRDAIKSGDIPRNDILTVLETRDDFWADGELVNVYAAAALTAGKLSQATTALRKGKLEPVLAARIHLASGEPDLALQLLSNERPRPGARSHFYGSKMRALIALERIEEAAAVANEWIAADRSTPQPYVLMARALTTSAPARAEAYFEQALLRSDNHPEAPIAFADHLARTGRIAEAQALVRNVDPSQAYYRRRREHILSLIA